MFTKPMSRRHVLAGSMLAGGLAVTKPGKAIAEAGRDADAPTYTTPSDVQPREPDFRYAIQRTEEEWRAMLSDEEFRILREGGTERPRTSPLWEEDRDGDYRCRGCSLLLYSSEYKTILSRGWVFFEHSEPDATMTGIDLVSNYGRREKQQTMIELHCRNCGSHLGHMVYISGDIMHCINGTALTFHEA